jgi:hypothetical protein
MPMDMSKPGRRSEHGEDRSPTRYGLSQRRPRESQSQLQDHWHSRQEQLRRSEQEQGDPAQAQGLGQSQHQTQGQSQHQTQGQSQHQSSARTQARTQSQSQGRSQTQSQRGGRQSQTQSRGFEVLARGISLTKPAVPEALAPEVPRDLAVVPPGTGAVRRARRIRSETPVKSRAERLLMVRNAEAELRATAVAERKVAQVLERLGPEWKILHSVPVGPDKPEVSHLLVGPNGVFSLASRTHRSARAQVFERIEAQVSGDAIRIQGVTMPWVAEARAQAWRTARALSAAAGIPVYVRAGVILLGVDDVRVYGKPPERVEVLHRRLLMKWLQRFPSEYRATTVNMIYAAARRSDTWLPAHEQISLHKP